MEQESRWEHLALLIAAALLLCAGIGFTIHLSGSADRKTPPWSVSVAFVVAAIFLGSVAHSSLGRALRGEELDRLLIAGLFELPPEPSEALVRLNAQLGIHFGLGRGDLAPPLPFDDQTLDYGSRTGTLPSRLPWPATLGEMRDAIYDGIERANARAAAEHPDPRQAIAAALGKPAGSIRFVNMTRIPLARFLAARQALADALDRPPESIRWTDRLADLIPAGRQRFIVWQRLRARAPNINEVDLNPWIETIAILIFLAALIAIALPIVLSLERNATTAKNPSVVLQLVVRASGLVCIVALIAILMVPVRIFGSRYACRLPAAYDTVASLAPWFEPLEPNRSWTPADVESHLRDLLAAALNRPPSEIGASTKF
jgi:hypothetical protein